MTIFYSISVYLVLKTVGAFHKFLIPKDLEQELNLIVSISMGSLFGIPFGAVAYRDLI